MTYSFGYHYNMPKRGLGYTLEWDGGYIGSIIKTDANRIKRDLINRGATGIELYKNEG